MPDRYIAITDREAKLAAEGKLLALVRVAKDLEIDSHEYVCGKWLRRKFNGLLLPRLNDTLMYSPFGAPGDTVHLKEAWIQTGGAFFEAYKVDGCEENGIIMSPVTMPRNLIRRHYHVKEVRAVQVNDLNYHDMNLLGFKGDGDYLTALANIMGNYNIHNTKDWVWYAAVEKIK